MSIGRRQLLKLGAAAVAARIAETQSAFSDSLDELVASRSLPQSFSGLRDAYAVAPEVTYFNHASIGTIPNIVQRAREGYQAICETNPWLYVWDQGWPEARETVRGKVADYLGCSPEEVALTHNTTEGFNLLAQGLPIGAGDEVLFSTLNHPGASVCWFHQSAARGFSVRQFDFPVGRAADLTSDELANIYAREISPRTRVLVFPHIDNIVGFRYPVRKLAELARDSGVEFVAVDGAQAVGMIPFRVADLGVDFYSTSPHKWLQAPKETGVLFVRRDVQESVRPMWVTWGQARWEGTVRVFEDYGTRNLPELMALGNAIEYQQRLGVDAKLERYRELREYFREAVEAHPRFIWRSPTTWEFSASLYAVELEAVSSRRAFRALFEGYGFVFRAFETDELNTMRVSPNVFNTKEEIDRFLELAGRL